MTNQQFKEFKLSSRSPNKLRKGKKVVYKSSVCKQNVFEENISVEFGDQHNKGMDSPRRPPDYLTNTQVLLKELLDLVSTRRTSKNKDFFGNKSRWAIWSLTIFSQNPNSVKTV